MRGKIQGKYKEITRKIQEKYKIKGKYKENTKKIQKKYKEIKGKYKENTRLSDSIRLRADPSRPMRTGLLAVG